MGVITKRDMLNRIREVNIDDEDIVNFCDEQIAALDNHNEKAREYKERKKKEQVDEIKGLVASSLTADFHTAEEFVKILDPTGELELTRGKISKRLAALVDEGYAVKEKVIVDRRKLFAYALASAINREKTNE